MKMQIKICISEKCKNKCEKHITNNEIDKGKTYSDKDFIRGCYKENET
ncbi:MAG: hypothetical protein IKG42_04820 [Clostridia bacterium]|nr:hypothetical protein [Clostridia bacterium]